VPLGLLAHLASPEKEVRLARKVSSVLRVCLVRWARLAYKDPPERMERKVSKEQRVTKASLDYKD
jgi:hypothetical protein